MDNTVLPIHTADILDCFNRAELHDSLYWTADFRFLAPCSDTFRWACADLEEIEPNDIELLNQCLEDLEAVDAPYYLPELFAARKRGMRPMRLWLGVDKDYNKLPDDHRYSNRYDEKVIDLFLAVGPERDPKSEG